MVRESVPFQRDMLTDPMDSHHFPQKGMAMDVATLYFSDKAIYLWSYNDTYIYIYIYIYMKVTYM